VTIDLDAFASRRLVLVRVERAVTGDPVADAPDVDDRGYRAPFRGPLVTVAAGRTVRVKLVRVMLERATPLFLESSDPSVFTLVDPVDGRLPAVAEHDVHLTGVGGGANRRDAVLRVRLRDAAGPVLHELHVATLRPLTVQLTPHVVTIRSAGAAGSAPAAGVGAIMAKVADVWVHYGIAVNVQPSQAKTVTLASADVVSDSPFPGELGVLLANTWPDGTANWVPNTINAYFVRQIGTGNTLGYGFSRASFAGFGLPNPGILLGDRTAGGGRSGLMHYANDLAHEIGHFFRLWHPENLQPPTEREDTWSRRMLMHNFNLMRGPNPWPRNDASGSPFTQRPRFADAGYGAQRRGCAVTVKDLPQLNGDGEMTTARAAIVSPAGPY